MPWLIIVFLLALWVLGILAFDSLGGVVHVLPVLAMLLLLKRVVNGPAALLQKRGNGMHGPFRKQ
jgi:hypothetical protein